MSLDIPTLEKIKQLLELESKIDKAMAELVQELQTADEFHAKNLEKSLTYLYLAKEYIHKAFAKAIKIDTSKLAP